LNQQLNFFSLKHSKLGEVIDRQHLQIRREYGELRKAILEGADLEKVLDAATDLILTTLLHFESEERAMEQCKNPKLTTHRQIHADLIESLKAISLDLDHQMAEGALELMNLFDKRMLYHLDVEDAELERILAN
jgi:hemerythrin-like metal-binding protein